jgi:hypothetical protein
LAYTVNVNGHNLPVWTILWVLLRNNSPLLPIPDHVPLFLRSRILSHCYSSHWPRSSQLSANHSSSCGARSAGEGCYVTSNKFKFPTSYLQTGSNTFTLALPPRATAPEDAVLPESVYLQYDALRLEVA